MKAPRFSFNLVNLLNIVGAVVIVYLIVVLGQTIKHNYDLNRQIDSLKTQVTQLQDQKDELSYNIQYYQSDAFKDREARAKLGLQLPGENVVVLPHPSQSASTDTGEPTTPKKTSNFRQWLDFLLGKASTS